MTPNRTAAAVQARRRATQHKLDQVRDAVAFLRRSKAPVTYPAVARRAGVSRTFLYENPGARALITAAAAKTTSQRASKIADADAQAEVSWRERALNAEEALKAAHAEIRTQRARIGHLLGQIRNLEHQRPGGTVEQLNAENAELKQRLRQATADNRVLEDRLQAARSNNRFLDKRIADLETQLLDALSD